MSNQNAELVVIVTKFAQSGWDAIDTPSKAWLSHQEDSETAKTLKLDLIKAIEKADKECGNCGCEYDALYKRALVLLQTK